MNTVTIKSHTGNTTIITTYAPTAKEAEGLLQAEQTLAFVETLDSEAYGWDCLHDQVNNQYYDILRDCKVVKAESKEESYDDFQMLWNGTKEVKEEDLTPFPFDKMQGFTK